MSDAVKRLEEFCAKWLTGRQNCEVIHGYEGIDLTTTDISAVVKENKRLREALKYCAESGDSGRWDGMPEDCPANDHVMMWHTAREALKGGTP